jgi:hypothetical protein
MTADDIPTQPDGKIRCPECANGEGVSLGWVVVEHPPARRVCVACKGKGTLGPLEFEAWRRSLIKPPTER